MSIRPVRPGGDRLTGSCGHHCGIRSAADEGGLTFIGHCPCDECRCPWATVDVDFGDLGPDIPLGRLPMCARWYERSGGVRPWERLADDGTMGACTPVSGSAG